MCRFGTFGTPCCFSFMAFCIENQGISYVLFLGTEFDNTEYLMVAVCKNSPLRIKRLGLSTADESKPSEPSAVRKVGYEHIDSF